MRFSVCGMYVFSLFFPACVCVCVYRMREDSSRVYENVGLMQQQKSYRWDSPLTPTLSQVNTGTVSWVHFAVVAFFCYKGPEFSLSPSVPLRNLLNFCCQLHLNTWDVITMTTRKRRKRKITKNKSLREPRLTEGFLFPSSSSAPYPRPPSLSRNSSPLVP